MASSLPADAKVRLATPSDLPQLLAIEQGSPTAAHWSEAECLNALVEALPVTPNLRRAVLVAEINGRVTGFLAARSAHPAEWEIENVAVETAAQRRGLGTALLDAFLERTRAARPQTEGLTFHLEVRESNLAARRLYEKFGFQLDNRRRAYYRDPGEDAILYSLYFQ